jgi:uncharacterized protein YnzC (UPF0291/DUF896 family)
MFTDRGKNVILRCAQNDRKGVLRMTGRACRSDLITGRTNFIVLFKICHSFAIPGRYNEGNTKGGESMKRKAAIIVAAVLLVAVLVQVGFAANNGENPGAGIKGICPNCWANLNPEEQEQARAAHEEFREKMEALREEFKERQDALREEYLNKLPEGLRDTVEERMALPEEQPHGKMRGPHCPGGPPEPETVE